MTIEKVIKGAELQCGVKGINCGTSRPLFETFLSQQRAMVFTWYSSRCDKVSVNFSGRTVQIPRSRAVSPKLLQEGKERGA